MLMYKKRFHYNLNKGSKKTFKIFVNLLVFFFHFQKKIFFNFINFVSLKILKLRDILVFIKLIDIYYFI